jgi:metal-responsive CopG/Arc/MetJ family transcriptional regulator
MAKSEFRSITIPEGLYKELEKYYNQTNGIYVTVSEVLREALREYLKNHA